MAEAPGERAVRMSGCAPIKREGFHEREFYLQPGDPVVFGEFGILRDPIPALGEVAIGVFTEAAPGLRRYERPE